MKKYYIMFAAAVVICVLSAACSNNTKAELISISDTKSSEENTADGPEGALEGAAFETAERVSKEAAEDTSGIHNRICVYVCGAVNEPGVYEFDEGSRAYEAVEAAGGFAFDAGRDYINLADVLSDGQKLKVPTKEEAEQAGSLEWGSEDAMQTGSRKININTADTARLTQIPGVGQSKADAIVSYRNQNGSFKSIDDIMNVPGIKEASFEKMKDYICTDP